MGATLLRMPTDDGLDDLDAHIVRLLIADGRRSFASIGAEVGLSVSAVKRRVDRLEADGVIAGYTVVLDRRKMGRPLEAMVELRVNGTANIEDIEQLVAGMTEARALFVTAGDPDAMVWLEVASIEDLQRCINALRRGNRVVGTKTLMVMKSWHAHGDV